MGKRILFVLLQIEFLMFSLNFQALFDILWIF